MTAKNGETNICNPPSQNITVELGDSLWVISQNYGIAMDEIKSFNNLISDTIYPGQKLKILATAPQTPESKPVTPSSVTTF